MEHITLRIPTEALRQVDQLRERLERQNGIPVSRADALRMLISKGLEATKK